MKIYVVIVNDGENTYAAQDWVGEQYEEVAQEVFFNKVDALRVFNSVNEHGTTYTVSLHEFEV